MNQARQQCSSHVMTAALASPERRRSGADLRVIDKALIYLSYCGVISKKQCLIGRGVRHGAGAERVDGDDDRLKGGCLEV